MQTRLILIRHGETEANVEQIWQGSLDAPLTARGRHQVEATAHHLRSLCTIYPLDAFYVSPLPRAQSTARSITESIQIRPQIDAGLREFDLGDWEGRSFLELRTVERLWERWNSDRHFAPPGGESPFSFNVRVVKAVRQLVDAHRNQNTLLVTHGGVICTLLATWFGEGPQDWRRFDPHNCAISIISLAGERWHGEQINDIRHLPAEARIAAAPAYVESQP